MSYILYYKIFHNFENIHQHLRKEGCFYISTALNKTYYWKSSTQNECYISHFVDKYSIEESPIKYIGRFYFYKENGVFYLIALNQKYLHHHFENKLYHLTHGSKAISIPEAFRILSL